LHIDSSGQIENQKLEFKAQSKVGSMDNVKHKPGGGDVKIFDDKEYIKQMTGQSPVPEGRTLSRQEVRLQPLLSLHFSLWFHFLFGEGFGSAHFLFLTIHFLFQPEYIYTYY
jgi:hypothetical protein